MADCVESYLRALHETHASGSAVAETSHYGALGNFLNEIGRQLKSRVRYVPHPTNEGAGTPDGGLFTVDQLQKGAGGNAIAGQLPSRGVVEVKGPEADAWAVAGGDQVARYCRKYGQVLVTSYREFVLVARDASGQPARLEKCSLAGSEAAFWEAAAHPRKTAAVVGGRLVEFLQRALLQAAQLVEPADVAWFLASYARDARARLEAGGLDALAPLRAALEEALGIKFEGHRGEHFFRSTLVQTLFYGVFSAWVLWSRQQPPGSQVRFDWWTSARYLRVPVLRTLYHEAAEPGRLDTLELSEVLDWACAALNRVDRAAFFQRFEDVHAVQYFYEPFLEAYDPELRKELGVWYTPPEIVRYMVARVDAVLRGELGIADGLADPRVYVLDPCCGTGAYLVEVLGRIAATLREKGGDALAGEDLKAAATSRVFGFEILPAPFVVAHLQLGLLLQRLGAPLSDAKKERAGVYLTNALTGWAPPEGPKLRLPFLEFEQERDAADRVKREAKILVVLGNPPYNGFAGMAVKEERELSNAYRTTKRAPAPQGQGLNDLYVRFFRMAERRIVEQTGRGVVCFISNYSWLDGLSFTGMRERYLEAFDALWIDCLNGDKYKTGKLTPEGDPDPSVFSTERNPEGIQVGTAIALLVRREPHGEVGTLRFRQLWGKTKRAQLVETAEQDGESLYRPVCPSLDLGLAFMPLKSNPEFFRWPSLPELFPVSFPGVKTSRDDVVVDIDRDRLVARMQRYFDPSVSHEEMARLAPGAMESVAGFDAVATRDLLRKRGFLPENVIRYCYRPFDVRWLYWEPETKLLDRNRAEYYPHVFAGNSWIEARQKQTMERFDRGHVVTVLADNFGNGLSNFFPMYLSGRYCDPLLHHEIDGSTVPNLSDEAATYLVACGAAIEDLFHHVAATLRSPSFRGENAGALRQGWPRIPLPECGEALLASVALGREVAALLDPEQEAPGVTWGAPGKARPELRLVARLSRVESLLSGPLDLSVTAGWGHAGKGGVTMPGRGRVVERDCSPEELSALREGAAALGLAEEDLLRLLGEKTLDVYLNPATYWSNVPARVWGYTIGGYQVVKKWLSYRELDLLGRPLKPEEAREVSNIARRIAALLLLEPELDANYRTAKAAPYPWPGAGTSPDG